MIPRPETSDFILFRVFLYKNWNRLSQSKPFAEQIMIDQRKQTYILLTDCLHSPNPNHFLGANFINILHTRFSFESDLRSFSLVMFWRKKQFCTKTCVENVDEIDTYYMYYGVFSQVD